MIAKKKRDSGTADVNQTGAGLYKYVPAGLIKFCVPIDSVKLYDKNPRRNDIAVPELMEGIKKSLFRKPIVIDQHGVIRAGNTAYKAAVKLGMKMIPVAQSDFESEASAVEYVMADNKLGERSAWDMAVLKELMVAHKLVDEGEPKAVAGFTDTEMKSLFDIKEATDKTLKHTIEVVVTCDSEQAAGIVFDKLTKEGYACRVLTM